MSTKINSFMIASLAEGGGKQCCGATTIAPP